MVGVLLVGGRQALRHVFVLHFLGVVGVLLVELAARDGNARVSDGLKIAVFVYQPRDKKETVKTTGLRSGSEKVTACPHRDSVFFTKLPAFTRTTLTTAQRAPLVTSYPYSCRCGPISGREAQRNPSNWSRHSIAAKTATTTKPFRSQHHQ